MTRASLLHILDHVTGITDAEARELEQLAAAFPYCQTAHLLLAKAAHDRGSMLASQRLRRAATYAADRELLRYLIELPAPALAVAPLVAAPVVVEAAPAVSPYPAATSEVEAIETETASALFSIEAPAAEPASDFTEAEAPTFTGEETVESQEVAEASAEAPSSAPEAFISEESELLEAPATEVIPAEAPLAAETEEAEQQSIPEQETVEPEATEAQVFEEPAEVEGYASAIEEVAVESSTPEAVCAEHGAIDQATEQTPPEQEGMPLAAEMKAEAGVNTPAAAELSVEELAAAPLATPEEQPQATAETATLEAAADELPPVAPPIRPPVEAGSSRFEFGLAEAPAPLPAYQLPELADEQEPAAGAFPPFRADEQLAYALASGSRLGACLTLRDAELTHDLPVADEWYPDAAMLAHLASHRPAPQPLPTSLTLIDRFLRSQPRIKSAASRPAPTDEPQADLSVRSTSAAPSLASESLAKIMVRQGKTARAIEIYEQLMQRQPEKKAYFAAQIDLLNQQTE